MMKPENLSIVLPGNVIIRGEDCKLTEKGGQLQIGVPMLPLAEALAEFYANVAIELAEQAT